MNKVLSIAVKEIKTTVRNKQALVLMALFPITFMLLLGFVFGGEEITLISVAVYDDDGGEVSKAFIDAINGTHIPEENRSDWIFKVSTVDTASEGIWRVGNGTANAYICIPTGFTLNLTTGLQTYINVTIDNANPTQAQIADGAIRGFMQDFTKRVIDERLQYMIPDLEIAAEEAPISLEEMILYVEAFHEPVLIQEGLSQREEMRYVDFLIPGMMGIAVLWIGITNSTNSIAKEKDEGTLRRILLTPTGPWPVLMGKTIGSLFSALVSAAIAVVAGMLVFNVTFRGDIPLAILVLILGALSSIGFGLIFSSIAKNREAANNMSVVFSLPVQFLTGLFFPLSMMPWFMQAISKILPFTYCVEALRDILIREASWSTVAPNVFILAIYSIGLYLAGALIYKRIVAG
jgi:ABC-2 type transport system permease protein